MMDARLVVGSRVRISTEYHWAKGATATVASSPFVVQNLTGESAGSSRVVESLHGPLLFYWVVFDVPQDDGSGDGPYAQAEIDSRYLSPA